MTPQEIDRRLALAIGYTADRLKVCQLTGVLHVLNDFSRDNSPWPRGGWQRFDHTNPAVIWPIAERFDAFPMRFINGTWFASIPNCNEPQEQQNVAATASALAVIAYVEGKV